MNSISSSSQPFAMSLVDPRTGAKTTGKAMSLDPSTAVKMTDAEMNEVKLWEEQTRARAEANERYAMEHPDKVYAQVTVNGKLFATVYDSGVITTPHQMAGLPDNGSGAALAEARLAHIAKAVGGKVIRSDFFPTEGGSSRGAPESELPRVTARSLDQILQDMLMRSRVDAASRDFSDADNKV